MNEDSSKETTSTPAAVVTDDRASRRFEKRIRFEEVAEIEDILEPATPAPTTDPEEHPS